MSRYAVLLEALGPSVDHLRLVPEKQLIALADTLRLAWTVPRPAGPDGDAVDKAWSLAEMVPHLWEKLDRPCPERIAAEALMRAERRSATGMNEAAIWEWGFLERVSTGPYALSLDAQDLARPFRMTAEAFVDEEARRT